MTEQKESRLQRRVKNREDRATVIALQRAQFHKRERNKKIFNYSIAVVIVAAIVYGVYVANVKAVGEHDNLANCLTSKGVVMYGTEWCPHCQEQKRRFGESFKFITFINCDLQPAVCNASKVEGYPTWTFPRGDPVSGEQTLESLASRMDCPLN